MGQKSLLLRLIPMEDFQFLEGPASHVSTEAKFL